jgi:hypothetical protein
LTWVVALYLVVMRIDHSLGVGGFAVPKEHVCRPGKGDDERMTRAGDDAERSDEEERRA